MSLNQDISDLFHSLAALMELKGENVFKVIAFQKVGRIVRELNVDLKKCIEEDKLCEIEGIGKSSQQIIEEFVKSGKSTVFEEIAASVPAGLVPLMSIEGLGPKTINLLWKEKGVTSLEIFVNSFFQNRTEVVPDFYVGLWLLFCELFEITEHPARYSLFKGREDGTFLNHFE